MRRECDRHLAQARDDGDDGSYDFAGWVIDQADDLELLEFLSALTEGGADPTAALPLGFTPESTSEVLVSLQLDDAGRASLQSAWAETQQVAESSRVFEVRIRKVDEEPCWLVLHVWDWQVRAEFVAAFDDLPSAVREAEATGPVHWYTDPPPGSVDG